jgi:hypothetical protein
MVLYTVKQDTGGLWSIRRMGLALFSDLRLAAAIELARSVARDEHERSNRGTTVEFHDVSSVIRVGNFEQAPTCERITTW